MHFFLPQWRYVEAVSGAPPERGGQAAVLRGRPHQGLRHVLRQQRLHARIRGKEAFQPNLGPNSIEKNPTEKPTEIQF